jgi:hypothetical protein
MKLTPERNAGLDYMQQLAHEREAEESRITAMTQDERRAHLEAIDAAKAVRRKARAKVRAREDRRARRDAAHARSRDAPR